MEPAPVMEVTSFGSKRKRPGGALAMEEAVAELSASVAGERKNFKRVADLVHGMYGVTITFGERAKNRNFIPDEAVSLREERIEVSLDNSLLSCIPSPPRSPRETLPDDPQFVIFAKNPLITPAHSSDSILPPTPRPQQARPSTTLRNDVNLFTSLSVQDDFELLQNQKVREEPLAAFLETTRDGDVQGDVLITPELGEPIASVGTDDDESYDDGLYEWLALQGTLTK
ncbi:hypothetical protein DL93DRAFT_2167991 [Clavulina sp. PMI_390]|nr:hypothetical protein DL93DRAFT_2167991 [Clavulina sp. PMI_390]